MKTLKIPLSWQIIISVIVAMLMVYIFPSLAACLGDATDLYVRLLALVLVPYLFAGIISALSNQTSGGFLGRLALKNLTWFAASETVAVGFALIISNIVFQNSTILIANIPSYSLDTSRDFGDFFMRIIPASILDVFRDSNVIFVLLSSCVISVLVGRCHDRQKLFLQNFFTSFSELMQKCSDVVAGLSPLGFFFLTCKLATTDEIFGKFSNFTPFLIAISLGLLIYSLVILPIVVKAFAKASAFRMLKVFSSTLFASFGFLSSTLAIPQAINKLKSELGVSSKVADSSMPMISVLSLNGSSIYLATAAMYIAQAYGINMSFLEQFVLIFAVIFISVAAYGFPLKLSVMLFPVLERMGIPIDGIGIFLACDLFFGMVCSCIDTWANICATTVIANSEGDVIKNE